MIEVNKTYKLKLLRDFPFNNTKQEYKVLSFYTYDTVICKPVNCDSDEVFLFMTKCLIDPEEPNDTYFN